MIFTRFLITTMVLAFPSVSIRADDKLPAEPAPIMCKKGELLLQDSFTGKHGKEWFRITGTFDVINDQLRGAENPKDNHHSELSTGATGTLKSSDVIVRFSFKFDGAKGLSVGLENPKGHVARAGAMPDGFGISRFGGKKDGLKMKLEPGTWHTVLWEVRGGEMVAQIDDQAPLYVEDDMLKVERTRLVLTNYGQYAWFDEIAVWKAEPDEQWPTRRERIKAGQGK